MRNIEITYYQRDQLLVERHSQKIVGTTMDESREMHRKNETVMPSSYPDILLSSEDVKGNNNVVPKPTGEANIGNGKNVAVGGESNVTNRKTAEPEKKKCETDKEEVKFSRYLESNTKLTQKQLNKIAVYLGNKWKSVGRNLDIQDVFLGNIQSDIPGNTEEQCFQMLKKWWEISETGMCTIGNLTKALIDAECHGAIPYLPLDEE
ncbi:uncharacterized protein LOC115224809 [Octopus sinensis]|uniref:Uncharacterized protein LOC115224809 n=1 Tax=Octopus sinensis TaxID=2607531 RepID=A0A6P7TJE8_9MOLL|nr:uncharacterized protein LOC115224809 [Octopus sinensis]